MPLLFQFEHGAFHRGTQPRPAGHALALKCKVLQLRRESRNALPHQVRRLLGLLFVGITGLDGPRGYAVCGEDHGHGRASFVAGLAPDRT